MNRRGFLGMLGAVVAASPTPKPSVDVVVTDPFGTPDAIAEAVGKTLMQRQTPIGSDEIVVTCEIIASPALVREFEAAIVRDMRLRAVRI